MILHAASAETDSDAGQVARITVPEGQVLLYARGMRVPPPQPPRSAWVLMITGVLPGERESAPPAAVTAKWCHGPLCSAETARRRVAVVPRQRSETATEVVIVQEGRAGWRVVRRVDALGPDWPGAIAATVAETVAHPPHDDPPPFDEALWRWDRDHDEVLLAHPGMLIAPPMGTPTQMWALEITDLELSEPPGEHRGPPPGFVYGVWHRAPLPPDPGFDDTVVVRAIAHPPGPGGPRVTVRLLHREHGQWRLVGQWPDLGTDWPEIITPTVRLLLSAHRRLLPHAAPLPSLHPYDPDPDLDE
ncbi:hypothetical protein INP57_25755 [Saccharopolyspora sp. HNM0986]|uniref:hypothetical protein n=1 Tax=Saccharopolyspora galaxeae TaxID=2781241 RepID=UPI00190B93E3|nr:hypothetical protein [Saccharopolyspora sp. HNM0986]MBK0870221.1 hypothetical protein [Saccharopolyspora sp. HNM0986]